MVSSLAAKVLYYSILEGWHVGLLWSPMGPSCWQPEPALWVPLLECKSPSLSCGWDVLPLQIYPLEPRIALGTSGLWGYEREDSLMRGHSAVGDHGALNSCWCGSAGAQGAPRHVYVVGPCSRALATVKQTLQPAGIELCAEINLHQGPVLTEVPTTPQIRTSASQHVVEINIVLFSNSLGSSAPCK